MSVSVPINIAEDQWKMVDGLEAKIEHSVVKACRVCGKDEGRDIEVSVLLANDNAIQELNKQYRGNILSYETIQKESLKDNKALMDHVTHLVVHGVLHLFGYDHEEEDTAREMEMIEISILKDFGIENPYEG